MFALICVLSYVCSPLCAPLLLSYVCSPLCSHLRTLLCVLSYVICVLAYVCSHMCARICLLSYVCSHMCALICLLSCALICLLLCALLCVSSSSSSPPLVSDPSAPRDCLGLLPGYSFVAPTLRKKNRHLVALVLDPHLSQGKRCIMQLRAINGYITTTNMRYL